VKFEASPSGVTTTRREFIGRAAAGAVSAASIPITAVCDLCKVQETGIPATPHARRSVPVVSFFLDQPYLDYTGLELPYVPPRGTRSGQPVSQLSEAAFRAAFYWL
jgi:hypothetical protein